MSNVFRLWVVCRLTSNPIFICGPETLGGTPITDSNSKYFGRVPMPKIMTAQFECIEYTNFLRPWSKAVLKQLNDMVLAKKREYWFTIYLAMFVLLHSCSMVTRRDKETAGKWGMRVCLFLFFLSSPPFGGISGRSNSLAGSRRVKGMMKGKEAWLTKTTDRIRKPRIHKSPPLRRPNDARPLPLHQQRSPTVSYPA